VSKKDPAGSPAAFSMSTTPGMPISSIVRRSISCISEALTNLIVSLKDHHSHAVTAFIGKAQVKTGDLVLTAELGSSALKSKARPTSRVVEDLNIPPPDPSPHSQTDGF